MTHWNANRASARVLIMHAGSNEQQYVAIGRVFNQIRVAAHINTEEARLKMLLALLLAMPDSAR